MKMVFQDVFKIYINKSLEQEIAVEELVKRGYKRVDDVFEEGDFSLKGDTLEIFPVNYTLPVRIEWEFDRIRRLYSFDKNINKRVSDYDFLIIFPHITRRRYLDEDYPLEAVLKIERGDYVVHTHYGIGKFLGIKTIKIKDKVDKFLEIEYANKDKLYVGREDVHLIQKYTSFSLKPPRLTRLGTNEWKRIKEKVSRGIKNFAWELLHLQAKRKLLGGVKFSPDSEWQRIFEEKFPYLETADQIKATAETKKDMESEICMDRIICGDVGYGKTEVAMRAAFKAVVDNKQVAFLVPTTILAYQHYLNFKERIKTFPLEVEMLSRFRTNFQQRDILRRLKQGKIDIIVGTHRLLSNDVEFKDLGLLIIDEEHRFGVEHKEKLKKIKSGVDVLTLSATPIPRTLYMSLVGLKDISLIRTPPYQRLAVKTKIIEFDRDVIREIIIREVKRGGQVFFINSRIYTLQRVEKIIRNILPAEIRIGVVHGKLPAYEMEETMRKFVDRKIDCLLSTAIVESGIDIPYANTIIINEAERFGLADLHQLRGRVGRLNIQAYAYLVVNNWNTLSGEAKKRLKMIEEFSHLGAGFDVAMKDLELRGAGNILGKQQHGFVWMVGLDLYCRLLKKEIEYLKQEWKIGRKDGMMGTYLKK